jgi:hypothetical protein
MLRRIILPALAIASIALVSLRPWTRLRAQSNPATPLVDPSVRTLLIRYGVVDTVEKTWRGRLEPDFGGAEIVSLSGYHFQQSDRINGREWEFKTRFWIGPAAQVDLSPSLAGPRPIFPNGIYARVKGDAGARFRLETGAGPFVIPLSELSGGRTLAFADGNIEVEVVPTPGQVSDADGEADFPALALRGQEQGAVAFQEYAGDHDRVVVREFGPNPGSTTFEIPETRDVFRPAVAWDGNGILHVVWSAQVDGNWDLYERRRTGSAWGPVERLTQAPESDIHARLIADSKGDLWLAWQGFRNGQSDILLKRYTQGKWGAEIRVSESAADDWEPALAAGPDGAVWVGWDSYQAGNYDIFVRPFRSGTPGPVIQVTRAPRFEAHASLAVDPQGRLWVGYDEAEVNWGKDYGYLFKDRGNPLYQSRRIRFARVSGDKVEEPAAALDSAFPLGIPDFLQYPQLAFTRDGQLVVAALELTRANRVIEVWGSAGVWENVVFTLDGRGWQQHRVLPDSTGAHDIRLALAASADGAVWAAWAADGRSFTNGQPRRQVVEMAKVDRQPAGDEIQMRAFAEEPELAFPTHPNEGLNLRTVRGYRITNQGHEYRILRGDLHRHTSLSADGVGDGSLWDFYRYVLDAASMDFSTVTDHQGGGTNYNWWKSQKSTDLFHTPGRLTAIYAYERSVLYPNGHRNIVFAKRGAPILPIQPGEQQNGRIRSADVVLPYLRQYNAIAFRHTTATNQGTDWKDHNNELEPLVEIFQGHRVVYEHEGGPHGATAEKLYMQRSGYRPAGFVWNALAKGYRFGIQASSDHCSTHISYSCVIADGLTREAIIDAMRKHHTYGATDNIVMDFRVKADGNEFLQGDELTAHGPYTLAVNVLGTGPIRRIDVIHNESYAYAETPTGRSVSSFQYVDPHPVKGENRYYVRVLQEDGAMAWSSPVWVKY